MKDDEIITDDYRMYYRFDLYLYFGNYLVPVAPHIKKLFQIISYLTMKLII